MRAVREDQHGTRTGYVYGCRCDLCRDATNTYMRGYYTKHSVRIKRTAADHPDAADLYAERTMKSIAWFEERSDLRKYEGWLP